MSQSPPASSQRMMLREKMIVGEAVEVDIQPASPFHRMFTGIIDYALYSAGCGASLLTLVYVFMSFTWPMMLNHQESVLAIISAIVVFIWLVVIPLLVEFFTHGLSAGRYILGTRVVRDDGGRISLRHSLVRCLVAVVEIWLTWGGIAVVTTIVTKRGKRMGDLMAGTYVVLERPGGVGNSDDPILMPPELSVWAASADLRPLPGQMALAARSFLQRAASLDANTRARLGVDFAEALREYVAPQPPPHTHPERFIAAVLAENRDRDYAQMQRQQEELARGIGR